jgi:hypothetical protein
VADECGALKMPQKEDRLFNYSVHLSRMMPPTPRSIPTTQESLPASIFSASLRSLSRPGFSCASSRSTWLSLPSLFKLKMPSCTQRHMEGPRLLTQALTAAMTAASSDAVSAPSDPPGRALENRPWPARG